MLDQILGYIRTLHRILAEVLFRQQHQLNFVFKNCLEKKTIRSTYFMPIHRIKYIGMHQLPKFKLSKMMSYNKE